MKTKSMIIGLAMIVIASITCVIGYAFGYQKGQEDTAKLYLHPPEYWEKLVELDTAFLLNISARSNTMSSGTYILETSFPGRDTERHTVELVFSNGQLQKTSQVMRQNLVTNGFTQEGNVIYARFSDMDEKAGSIYIGVIAGNMMTGKVYIPSNYGWHMNPTEIGVWKIYQENPS